MRRNFDQPKPHRRFDTFWLKAGGIVALILVVIVGYNVLYFGSRTTLESCTVDSKDRGTTVTSDGDGNVTSQTDYRVYTDCGVFTVADNFFLGKFNSADTYGSLSEGKTYDLEVIGWRNGFLSWFPNILSAEKVS